MSFIRSKVLLSKNEMVYLFPLTEASHNNILTSIPSIFGSFHIQRTLLEENHYYAFL